ncbi:hypothetical protein LCGC14_2980060 [marine sediment metagenome]|uniref:Uncharacterized protein n=1 Tax=marine sediment metagenome TaxID=412755 RepID=A0A0F8ZEG4_9ZZZZ
MRIYTDKLLTQELGDKTFSLGIVEAGENKQFTYWVENDSKLFIKEIKFLVTILNNPLNSEDKDELFILEAPETLIPFESKKLILEWRPSITLEESLEAVVNITAIRLTP